MGMGSFPGVVSGRGVTLIPQPLLVPRSKNRAIPLLSLRAFVAYKKGETNPISPLRLSTVIPTQLIYASSDIPKSTHSPGRLQMRTALLQTAPYVTHINYWGFLRIKVGATERDNYANKLRRKKKKEIKEETIKKAKERS
jgi:hypothetical protein